MKKLQYADTVLAELTSVLAQVDDAQAEQLIEKICQAQTVFLAGSGRSGLAGKAFAMRLGHLGKQAAVIGETMTPPFCPGDLLLACSGSGESGAQLAALAGTGDWQEGQRFPSAVTQQEVTDWVKSLGK